MGLLQRLASRTGQSRPALALGPDLLPLSPPRRDPPLPVPSPAVTPAPPRPAPPPPEPAAERHEDAPLPTAPPERVSSPPEVPPRPRVSTSDPTAPPPAATAPEPPLPFAQPLPPRPAVETPAAAAPKPQPQPQGNPPPAGVPARALPEVLRPPTVTRLPTRARPPSAAALLPAAPPPPVAAVPPPVTPRLPAPAEATPALVRPAAPPRTDRTGASHRVGPHRRDRAHAGARRARRPAAGATTGSARRAVRRARLERTGDVMSDTLGLAAVTATLRHELDAALTAADGRGEGVTGAVTVGGPPSKPPPGTNAGAFVFLYSVNESPAWRNRDVPTRDEDGRLLKQPVAPMALRYLITGFGDEAQLEPSRVLGVIVTHLHAAPVLTPQMIQDARMAGVFSFLLNSDLDQQVEHVRLTPVPLDDEALNRIWSMLPGRDLALSVIYDALVVLLAEPAEAESVPLPVLQRGARALTARRPRVTAVGATGGTSATAIHAGDSIDLVGEVLAAPGLGVELDGAAVPAAAIATATEEHIQLTLPATTLPGPRVGQVVHDLGATAPSTTAMTAASDPFVILVRPDVTGVSKGGGNVRVDVASAIGATQTLEIVLNLQGAAAVKVLPGTLATPTRVTAPLAGLTAGTYLVRLRVDGVEAMPGPPTFAFPTVVVP
jgi:hypothetical protein